MTLEVQDYVGSPTQRCAEHEVSYYFVCLKCHAAQHGRGMHQAPGQEAPAVQHNGRRKRAVL